MLATPIVGSMYIMYTRRFSSLQAIDLYYTERLCIIILRSIPELAYFPSNPNVLSSIPTNITDIKIIIQNLSAK